MSTLRAAAKTKQAYEEVFVTRDIGSDAAAFDSQLSNALSASFRVRTGRRLAGELLFAAIMAKRKRGEWIILRQQRAGFKDIDQVG